ncbi:hypothetical protein NHX12_022046 [Muraenolepis orangiensis]|uniref:Uncharacterized protein n=1 Tax=Muraenolepis orangiensis TaxID=630683 RepID=A0A9Q0ELP9_9TELE|nr:hypothetical protein NHX12_022046 [Muraenolepis orangiensis]
MNCVQTVQSVTARTQELPQVTQASASQRISADRRSPSMTASIVSTSSREIGVPVHHEQQSDQDPPAQEGSEAPPHYEVAGEGEGVALSELRETLH